MKAYAFGYGLAAQDAENVHSFLQMFLSHVDSTKMVICGRLALLYWAQGKVVIVGEHLNEVDIVVRNITSVKTSVLSQMWLLFGKSDYLALYSRMFGIKVDVFTHNYPEPEEQVHIEFAGLNKPVLIVSLECAVAHAIFDCWEIGRHSVDPKHFDHVERFLRKADPEALERSWNMHFQKETGMSYLSAWDFALYYREKHPEQLRPHPFSLGILSKVLTAVRFASKTIGMRFVNAEYW